MELAGDHTAAEVRSWMRSPSTAPDKMVFLTFDDGPDDVGSPQVLKILRDAGVKATFFVVGQKVSKAPQVLRQEVAEGHRIGLHSLTHDYKKLYPGRVADPSRIALEVDATLAKVRAEVGKDFSTTAWRYPGGHASWTGLGPADAELEARGLTWMDWNAVTGDAEPKKRRPTTVAGMVDLATEPINRDVPVVVLLAHDFAGNDMNFAALPEVMEAYADAGYAFGTLI